MLLAILAPLASATIPGENIRTLFPAVFSESIEVGVEEILGLLPTDESISMDSVAALLIATLRPIELAAWNTIQSRRALSVNLIKTLIIVRAASMRSENDNLPKAFADVLYDLQMFSPIRSVISQVRGAADAAVLAINTRTSPRLIKPILVEINEAIIYLEDAIDRLDEAFAAAIATAGTSTMPQANFRIKAMGSVPLGELKILISEILACLSLDQPDWDTAQALVVNLVPSFDDWGMILSKSQFSALMRSLDLHA